MYKQKLVADVIDFNQMLYRPLRDGSEYENLIPESNCTKTDAGVGLTDHSISRMTEVIEKYSWQLDEVAQLLQRRSLKDTVNAIFDFTYNHFQYKADQEDQMLRSPACSWSDRENGIDCKSYSIIASCILLELGIKHYIRKIKQPAFAPDEFTHVYVIVPHDQQTGGLQGGYYVIDGTVSNNEEPQFSESKDEYMSGLQHYALNGTPQGMGISINLNTIAGGILGCDGALNNSSYSPAKIKQLFPNGLKAQLVASGLQQAINSASLTKFVALMNRVAVSGNILATGGYDKCTTGAGKLLRDASIDAINAVLAAIQVQGLQVIKGAKQATNYDVKFGTYNNGNSFSTSGHPSDTFTVVGTGTLNFDVNSLVLTAVNPASPIPNLPNIDINYPQPDYDGGGINPSTGSTYEDYEDAPKTTSKAGMGTIVGLIIMASAVAYAFKGDKSTAKTSKQ